MEYIVFYFFKRKIAIFQNKQAYEERKKPLHEIYFEWLGFTVLVLLFRRNREMTRSEIKKEVVIPDTSTRNIDTHVRRIRQKIETCNSKYRYRKVINTNHACAGRIGTYEFNKLDFDGVIKI